VNLSLFSAASPPKKERGYFLVVTKPAKPPNPENYLRPTPKLAKPEPNRVGQPRIFTNFHESNSRKSMVRENSWQTEQPPGGRKTWGLRPQTPNLAKPAPNEFHGFFCQKKHEFQRLDKPFFCPDNL